jgi:hypothetical protein
MGTWEENNFPEFEFRKDKGFVQKSGKITRSGVVLGKKFLV